MMCYFSCKKLPIENPIQMNYKNQEEVEIKYGKCFSFVEISIDKSDNNRSKII